MPDVRTSACLVAALLAACGDSDPAPEPAAPAPDAGDATGRADASELDAATPPTSTGPAWQWIEVPGSICRDGSVAGFHVSRADTSQGLFLYLEGGGACYDAQTCLLNPANNWQQPPVDGLFAREHAENPVADWSFVYVPYCSGDHYVGDAGDVAVPEVPGLQQFRGRRNLELFLARMIEELPDAPRVLLSGTSAGGIGTLMSYRLVQEAFGATPVTVIDDSGPLLPKEHTATCLSSLRRSLWNVDDTALADCGEQCPDDDDWAHDYALYNLEAIPRASGLITSTADAILRAFIGIGVNGGKNDCMGSINDTPFDAESFRAGLLDLRANIAERSDRFGTFYPESEQHGWVVFPGLYTQTAGDDGTRMIDWVRAILDDQPATHVGE